MKEENNLINAYNDVFNKDKSIKLCGREKCIKLIKLLNTIEGRNDGYFGLERTGAMDVEHIHACMEEFIKNN